MIFNIFINVNTTDSIRTLLLSCLTLLFMAIAILDVVKYVTKEALGSNFEVPKNVKMSSKKFVVISFMIISPAEVIMSFLLANKENFSLFIYPT